MSRYILSILFTFIVGFSYGQHLPDHIQKEINNIQIDLKWSATLDLGDGYFITVRLAKAGPNQEHYLFYPDKPIPYTNQYWETLFPLFRTICTEAKTKQGVWALNNICINVKHRLYVKHNGF